MTSELPGILGYGPNRLFKRADTVSDNNGNATLAFDATPSAEAWTGSVFCAVPANNIAGFVVTVDSQYLGTFNGFGALSGVQAADGAQVTVTATLLPPKAQVTVVWRGRRDPVDQAPVTVPWVSGPIGIQQVASSTLFPVNVQQAPLPANVLSAEVDSDQGSGINILVAGIGGSRIRLWSATLSMAMAELAATVGVKAWACDIEVHGGAPVVLKMPLRTVPGTAVNGSVSQNCYGLTAGSGLGIDLNSPANTADGSRVVGTVLYDVVTP